MESETDEQKHAKDPQEGGDTDAYYGEDDADMGDLDLSFLDEEEEQ